MGWRVPHCLRLLCPATRQSPVARWVIHVTGLWMRIIKSSLRRKLMSFFPHLLQLAALPCEFDKGAWPALMHGSELRAALADRVSLLWCAGHALLAKQFARDSQQLKRRLSAPFCC